MRRELEHFMIGNSYGGNQDWFRTFMMRIGGCGAETACDSSLYFALRKGVKGIYPFDTEKLSKREYVDFAHMMEKYLWPRMTGIDKLSIYVDGYSKYLADRGVTCICMDTLDGSEPYEAAVAAVKKQIDNGYPIPTLILNRKPLLTVGISGSISESCGIPGSITRADSFCTGWMTAQTINNYW